MIEGTGLVESQIKSYLETITLIIQTQVQTLTKNSSRQLQGKIDAFNPTLPYTFKN